MLKILKAASILIGTIIGVGIFGLPYIAKESNLYLVIFYLLVLGLLTTTVHWFYAEIIISSRSKERLISYIKKYLGEKYSLVAKFTVLFSLLGALLAYIIVSGIFIEALFGINHLWGSLLFFVLGSVAIFLGLKTVSWLELIMTAFLLLIMLVLTATSFPYINLDNFLSFNFNNFFLGYGVVLFALAGLTAIPEMAELLRHNRRELKISVILGTLLPVFLFIVFTAIVFGVTGKETTPEALIGLGRSINGMALGIGLWFGLLALYTSYIAIGLDIKNIFSYDFKLSSTLSWALTSFIPLSAFLLGLRNFIAIIGFLGAIFGAGSGIFVALVYGKVKKKKLWPILITLIFALGMIYEIYRRFTPSF